MRSNLRHFTDKAGHPCFYLQLMMLQLFHPTHAAPYLSVYARSTLYLSQSVLVFLC